MKNFLFVLLYIFTLSVATADSNLVAGKSKSLICSGCHGRDGNSDNSEYPLLAGQGQGYLIKQILDFKSGVRKDDHMTSIVEAVSVEDIKPIAEYFSMQQRRKSSAPTKISDLGKKIFHNGNSTGSVGACAACHGKEGKGNAALNYPSVAGQYSDYVAKTLKEFRNGIRRNDKQAVMRTIAARLSEQDIEALAAYIATMP